MEKTVASDYINSMYSLLSFLLIISKVYLTLCWYIVGLKGLYLIQ